MKHSKVMRISRTPHPLQLQLSPQEQVWAPPVQLQLDPQPQPMMKRCGISWKVVIVFVGSRSIGIVVMKRTLEIERKIRGLYIRMTGIIIMASVEKPRQLLLQELCNGVVICLYG